MVAGGKVSKAGSLIGAAKASVGGFKGALSGLAGAFNPLTIGITAAVAGLAAYGQAQANAEAASQSLLETLDKTNGAFSKASTANIRDALMGDLSTSDQTLLSDLGVSLTEAANAALAGGPAFENYQRQIVAMRNASVDATGPFSQQSRALDGLASSLVNQGEVIDDTRAKQALLTIETKRAAIAASDGAASANAAEGDVAGLAKSTVDLADAQAAAAKESGSMTTLLEQLGAKSEEAAARLKSLSEAVDLLGGGSRALQAATDAQAASIDKVTEAAIKATEATQKKTTKDYGSAEKTRDVAAANRDYRAALRDVATATGETIKQQQNSGKSVGELTKSYNTGRSAIEKSLRAHGFHGAALKAEADKIIGTQGDYAKLLAEYAKNPKNVDTKVTAPGAVNATREVKVFTGIVNGVPQYKTVTINAAVDRAVSGILGVAAQIRNLPAYKNIDVNVSVSQNVTRRVSEITNSAASFAKSFFSAQGDIIRAFDGGGLDLPNAHQPHIAPAGSWRVFGEPETQGEGYIPLANDGRRPRAKSIMETIADRFGGSIQWNATGGVSGGITAPLGSFYRDFITSLGETVTKAMLAANKKAIVTARSGSTKVNADRVKNLADNAARDAADRRAIAAARRDRANARTSAQRSAAADKLAEAEAKLAKDRRDATADTAAYAAAIAKVRTATNVATAAEAAGRVRYTAQSQSTLTKFGKGLTTGVKNSSTFIKNIETIASRGYVVLAQQLAAMSDEDAERIASEAARASTGTLNSLQGQVNTQISNEQKLGSINAISAILGSVRSKNLNVRQLSDSTGIDTTELLEAAKLIKSQLVGNKNASRLLVDLANYGKGQTVFDAVGPSASDLRPAAAAPIPSRVGVSSADVARTQLTFARLEATLAKLEAARPTVPAGPILHIDKVTTVDVDAAARALTTRLGDALALTDLNVGG